MTQAAQEAAAPANQQAPAQTAPAQEEAAEEAAPAEDMMSFDEFQSKLEAGEIDSDGNPTDKAAARKPAPEKPKEGDKEAAPAEDEGEAALKSVRQAAREAKQRKARQAQIEQELVALRQQVQRAQTFEQKFKENPVALAREMGMTPRQLSELFMAEAGPDNELAITQRELAALKQELTDLKTGQQSQAKQRQLQAFAEGIVAESSKEDLYPLLSEAPEIVVHNFVASAIDYVAEKGEDPRDYGQDELVALAEKLYAKSRRKKGQAPQVQTPQVGNGRKAPKSVTTDMTTDFSQLPANFDEMSPEEQEKALNMKFFGKP